MCTTKMNDSTSLKKLSQSDAAFINLPKRVLDQSHIHHHFQLVGRWDTLYDDGKRRSAFTSSRHSRETQEGKTKLPCDCDFDTLH